jgi:outer membrane protein TolC
MKRWLALTLCGISVAAGQTPQVLRLEDAVAIGKRQSRVLQMAAARAEGAEAKAGEAGAARWGSLRVAAGYLRVSPGNFSLNLQLPGALGAALSPEDFAPPVVEDNYTLRVALQQPLFTGFRLSSAANAAQLNSEAAVLDRDLAADDLVLNVSTAYWALFQSLETTKLFGENVARLESYVADTRRLVDNGMATTNDLLKIEVQLANARVQLIDATNDAALAAMNLNAAIGQPVETEIALASSPEEILRADSVAAASSIDGVLELRKDYRSAGLMRDAARENVRAASGSYWPQIDLTAAYNYNRPFTRYQPITPEFLGGWEVGVQMSLDLWNWGRTARQTEQAEAVLRQSEQQLAQLKDNITLEVHRATLSKHRAGQKVGAARLAVTQAEEHLRITNNRYRSGLATASDLLDAEVSVLQARTTLSGSAVEYAVADARLVRAKGGR